MAWGGLQIGKFVRYLDFVVTTYQSDNPKWWRAYWSSLFRFYNKLNMLTISLGKTKMMMRTSRNTIQLMPWKLMPWKLNLIVKLQRLSSVPKICWKNAEIEFRKMTLMILGVPETETGPGCHIWDPPYKIACVLGKAWRHIVSVIRTGNLTRTDKNWQPDQNKPWPFGLVT